MTQGPSLRSAEARLNSTKTRLERRRMLSPVAGGRSRRFISGSARWCSRPGPILSMLPPGNVKVRFFVPQAMLPTCTSAIALLVRCDGCAQ